MTDKDIIPYESREFDDYEGFIPKAKEYNPEEELAWWREVFRRDELTAEETYPARIRVTYRIIRELARLKHIVLDDMTLREATKMHPSPWDTPVKVLVRSQEEADQLVKVGLKEVQTTELSLLPPPQNGEDPLADRKLAKYVLILRRIAENLGVFRTTEGKRGVLHLLNPKIIRNTFPPAQVLLAWEDRLLDEALAAQVNHGVPAGISIIRRRYGLSRREAHGFASLARKLAAKDVLNELETEKGLLARRVDNIARRAQRKGDLKSEIAALKLYMILQGIHKAEADDVVAEMVRVIETVSKKHPEIPPPPGYTLEGEIEHE